jgi:hypothetical protein
LVRIALRTLSEQRVFVEEFYPKGVHELLALVPV